MQFANLAEMIQVRKRLQEQNKKFMERHRAIEVLAGMNRCVSHFLAKRLGQGRAVAEWVVIHPQCFRLTVTYRGQVWNIRVPVP